MNPGGASGPQGAGRGLLLTSPLGPGIVVFRTPRSIRGQHKSSLVCAAATGACRSGPVPCVFRDKKEPRPLADPEKPLRPHKDYIYVLPLGLWRHCGELCQFSLDARLCRAPDCGHNQKGMNRTITDQALPCLCQRGFNGVKVWA